MIRLYGICPAWRLPDVSTFVTQVDCYLRMANLPYRLVSLLGENFPKALAAWSSGDLPKWPKDKFPFVARVLWCPYDSPLKTHARTLLNFETYCQRTHAQYCSSRT